MKVAVLKGGLSSEREISLISGEACAQALREEGYDVIEIDVTRDLWNQLSDVNPDVIFNALHGDWGEDGRVQGVLDMFGKPYTHSGVLSSALAMDKHRAKHVLRAVGINVAEGGLYNRLDVSKHHQMKPPYVVKPNGQGSSKSVYIIHDDDPEQKQAIAKDKNMGEEVIVEAFIPGRELTVTVMGDKALGVTEIIPQTEWYDFEAKYSEGGSAHMLPADIPEDVAELCLRWALKAHKALGCQGLSRADYRFNEKNDDFEGIVNKIVMLEVNTQPGMTPTSLAPEQAAHVGVSFGQLCRWLVEDASWPR